jgi:hypothetical protein
VDLTPGEVDQDAGWTGILGRLEARGFSALLPGVDGRVTKGGADDVERRTGGTGRRHRDGCIAFRTGNEGLGVRPDLLGELGDGGACSCGGFLIDAHVKDEAACHVVVLHRADGGSGSGGNDGGGSGQRGSFLGGDCPQLTIGIGVVALGRIARRRDGVALASGERGAGSKALAQSWRLACLVGVTDGDVDVSRCN